MTPTELKRRVTLAVCVAAVALSAITASLAGLAAAVGILAGGGLAIVNFRWLVAHAGLVTAHAGASGAWLIGVGVRFFVFLALAGALLATGVAHPVALLVGVTLLPCAVVAHGLRAAREER